jgi:hypothetical protein
MSDQPLLEAPRYQLHSAASPQGLTKREQHRLHTLQRMIDRLEHRAADPTFRKNDWMMAELSALSWAMRVLRGNPSVPLGVVVREERSREQRT